MYRLAILILKPIAYLLFRPVVIGKQNVKTDGASIIVANHISLWDPIVLACYLPTKIHFMAKKELFKTNWFAKLLKSLGAFPVDRGNNDIAAVKHSLTLLREGKVLGIFPEGTRAKTDKMGPFNQGAAVLAYRTKAQVIPVAIFKKGKRLKRLVIHVGTTEAMAHYYQQKNSAQLIEAMTNSMKNEITSLLKG